MENSRTRCVLEIKTNINNLQEKPNKIKDNIKCIYDLLKSDSSLSQGDGLPELITNHFDAEEIWWQLDAENKSLHFKLKTQVHQILNLKDQLCDSGVEDASDDGDQVTSDEGDESIQESANEMEVGEDSNDDDEMEMNKAEESDDDGTENEETDDKVDKFFNVKDMEKFLNDEDQKAMKTVKKDSDDSDAESEIDFFEGSDEEDGDQEPDIKYKNFFDAPQGEDMNEFGETGDNEDDNEDDEEGDEEDDEEMVTVNNKEDKVETKPDNETVSGFELRQDRLKKKIGHLERAALEEKGWQLKGEITASTRPQNSLLEEDLDFDVTKRPELVITAETNLKLEDILIQRVKDKAWDSVKRKVKLVEEPFEFKKKLALNAEKGKESLAQIYEKEYLEQKEKLDEDANERKNDEPPEKIKTTAMINNLFSKLDSLSHFYFTPRLVKPEARIISNLPAIQMEEVAPVGVSDAHLLAPEEVRAKDKVAPMAKEERTKTDKKRERKFKKIKQHKRRLQEEAKQADGGEPKSKKQRKAKNGKFVK